MAHGRSLQKNTFWWSWWPRSSPAVPKVLQLVQTGRESSTSLVWEMQLKAAQATGGSRAVADGSTLSPVAAEMGKIPPQQEVQGLIELKLDVLHHLQVSASGGKE